MVDDSKDDVALVQAILEKSGYSQFFQAAAEGEAAIAYLLGQGKFADRKSFPFPNALLIDLKTAGLDGFGLLRWFKEHPDYKVFPTIVLASAFLESDVSEVYALGASAFVARPSGLDELIDLVHATYHFWSRCHTPPPPVREPQG